MFDLGTQGFTRPSRDRGWPFLSNLLQRNGAHDSQQHERQGARLRFNIITMADGRKGLYFPAVFQSDMHLGTHGTRAKRLCLFYDLVQMDYLKLVGDIIGGTEMTEKKNFRFGGKWHKQVLGHFLRKAADGVNVTFIPGNHDEIPRGKKIKTSGGQKKWHRKLTGKSMLGIYVQYEGLYADPKGRQFRVLHGDKFDSFGGFWYKVGDWFITQLQNLDRAVQTKLPFMREHSIAAMVKRAFKTVIMPFMAVKQSVLKYANRIKADGVIYGHSHIAGFQSSINGSIAMNDGCCTEHVQALVHDKDGVWAVLTMYADRFDVEQEDGQRYEMTFDQLGLTESVEKGPTLYRDGARTNVGRLLRLIARTWPSKSRSSALEEMHQIFRRSAVKRADVFPHSPPSSFAADFNGADVVDLDAERVSRLRDEFLQMPIKRKPLENMVPSSLVFADKIKLEA
ncbi:MAG: metallophosphoesterase [Pseudobdellovibrionaceae bacterium]|jgi:UDP-2,3-diacylglucosamine pyrophosphatase LpxH|nr:metallophosphoesterase [Pseudobdellovibrionaceae bacterium]